MNAVNSNNMTIFSFLLTFDSVRCLSVARKRVFCDFTYHGTYTNVMNDFTVHDACGVYSVGNEQHIELWRDCALPSSWLQQVLGVNRSILNSSCSLSSLPIYKSSLLTYCYVGLITAILGQDAVHSNRTDRSAVFSV